MKTNKFVDGIKAAFGHSVTAVKSHSPEILLVTGIVGVVATVVTACVATRKVDDILERHKEELGDIEDMASRGREDYTQEDKTKDLTITYTKTALRIVKLYGPTLALGVASVVCILSSNDILKKRNAALAAAYTTVSKALEGKNDSPIEKLEQALNKSDDISEEEKESKPVSTVRYSPYARIFDESNPNYEKYPDANKFFIQQIQNRFKNEAFLYDGISYAKMLTLLGFIAPGEHVPDEYKIIGYKDPEDIDLGIMNHPNFVNGYERSVVIDFKGMVPLVDVGSPVLLKKLKTL